MLNYSFLNINYNDKLVRNHFLKIVLPNAFQNKMFENSNVLAVKHSATQDPLIEHLNQHLMSNFGTPPISAYCLFYFTAPLPIHLDGHGNLPVTRANLNLPLSGWEGNLMNYYTENPGYVTPKALPNGRTFCDPNQVTLCDQFETTDDWVLVRADRPHNITNMDFNNPRITLSIKFKDNPSFEHLYKCLVGEPLSV